MSADEEDPEQQSLREMIAGLYQIEERKTEVEEEWKRLWITEIRASAKQRSRTAVETDAALALAHASVATGILGLAAATDLSGWFVLGPLIAGLGTTVFMILGLWRWRQVKRIMDGEAPDDAKT